MKKIKKKKNTSFFVKLAVFAFAVFAVITVVQLQLELNEKIEERDRLRAEVDELEDKKDELEANVGSQADQEYIIDIAKSKLNLRMPEEIIFYNDLFS